MYINLAVVFSAGESSSQIVQTPSTNTSCSDYALFHTTRGAQAQHSGLSLLSGGGGYHQLVYRILSHINLRSRTDRDNEEIFENSSHEKSNSILDAVWAIILALYAGGLLLWFIPHILAGYSSAALYHEQSTVSGQLLVDVRSGNYQFAKTFSTARRRKLVLFYASVFFLNLFLLVRVATEIWIRYFIFQMNHGYITNNETALSDCSSRIALFTASRTDHRLNSNEYFDNITAAVFLPVLRSQHVSPSFLWYYCFAPECTVILLLMLPFFLLWSPYRDPVSEVCEPEADSVTLFDAFHSNPCLFLDDGAYTDHRDISASFYEPGAETNSLGVDSPERDITEFFEHNKQLSSASTMQSSESTPVRLDVDVGEARGN